MLHELKPGPMVSFNKAIAIGYAQSPDTGIQELQKITDLKDHYLYLTAVGNFYLLKGDTIVARVYLEKALSKTQSAKEAALIRKKILKCN